MSSSTPPNPNTSQTDNQGIGTLPGAVDQEMKEVMAEILNIVDAFSKPAEEASGDGIVDPDSIAKHVRNIESSVAACWTKIHEAEAGEDRKTKRWQDY
ncbi:hypothetical protein MKZ38_007886 [Zalerion maritima]|uniref:Uncharacterized protein n=1 Tax=Zalerion maritima TaxID=339359 RepID=A0AAD5RHA3_9PEZI|nr:hypothetical protein MKZ38_007886 [Zalerion maritima]